MSSTLEVTGGALLTVTTDAMAESAAGCLATAESLRSVEEDLRTLLLSADAVQTRTSVSAAELAGLRTASALQRIQRASRDLVSVRLALLAAADLYAFTEQALAAIENGVVENAVSAAAPAAALVLPAAAVAVLLPALVRARARAGDDAEVDELLRLILADHAVVEAVRVLSGTVDELVLAASGLPAAATGLLGEDGFGLLGREQVATAAFALLSVGGITRESAVSVRQTRSERSAPPQGVEDLVARIPHGAAEQIRIERYTDAAGRAHATVYLGGTTVAADQPWDMTSNLAAVAGQDAGSIRAAEAAMAAAGVGQGDSVIFVGYSQGGLIASRLAESGDWNTVGIVTAGSPGGPIAAPEGIAVLALEHEEDVVVALGGTEGRPLEETRTVVITRSLGDELPDALLAGHDFDAYRESAALADRSEDAALQSVRDELIRALRTDGEVEVSSWEARRES